MKSRRYLIKVSEEVYAILSTNRRPGQTFDGALRDMLLLEAET